MFDVRFNSRRRNRGFSFAEVMFAVVILGIGFIMIAAIFPVAIHQTQANGEDNIAALAAWDAAKSITALPGQMKNPAYIDPSTMTASAYAAQLALNPAIQVQYFPLFPPTVKNYILGNATGQYTAVAPPGIVVPFNGLRWKMLQSDTVVLSDQRYAYIPFYRRDNNSATAELIVISVAVRSKSAYSVPTDAVNANATATVTTPSGPYALDQAAVGLDPNTGRSSAACTTIYPDIITVTNQSSGVSAPAEGASVAFTGSPAGTNSVGRTYTLGPQRGGPTSWEINPGDGMALTGSTIGVTQGLWGGPNPVRDQPINNVSCSYYSGLSGATGTTLQPVVAYADLKATSDNPSGQICLYAGPGSSAGPAAAATGAFIIVADDYPFDAGNVGVGSTYPLMPNNPTANPPFMVGALNGRIFRLGALVGPGANTSFGGGTVYNLDPAYGMRPTPTGGVESPDTVPSQALIASASAQSNGGSFSGSFRVKVYLIGAAQVNGSYTGSAQDIGVFATYFPVQ